MDQLEKLLDANELHESEMQERGMHEKEMQKKERTINEGEVLDASLVFMTSVNDGNKVVSDTNAAKVGHIYDTDILDMDPNKGEGEHDYVDYEHERGLIALIANVCNMRLKTAI
nr:hypothetical protein [Tanacetum cinerariifolium]